MSLLPSVASTAMSSLSQLFEFYLASVYHLFGPGMDRASERVQQTLARIHETTILQPLCSDQHLFDVLILSQPNRYPFPASSSVDAMFTSQTGADPSNVWRDLLSSFLVVTASLEYLAISLDQVILPHLMNWLPESKRGLAIVLKQQSITSSTEMLLPFAVATAPLVLNTILCIPDQNNLPVKTRSELLSSMQRDGVPNFVQRVLCHEEETFNGVEMPEKASPWVMEVQLSCQQLADALSKNRSLLVEDSLSRLLTNFGGNWQQMPVLWQAICDCISQNLLMAFGRVEKCTREGRCQMLLDAQTLAASVETVSEVRPFPDLERIINYVQAYYTPLREFPEWLRDFATFYSQDQLLGLAKCMTIDCDKKTRSRLISAVESLSISSQE
ncbi:hypothetical protein Ciccas_000648 [Cichlidogyrus casuarinus]|uniref:Syndetin C-terminal domain-containing protein n=1 Tax=Cichlidogyrus casuarinus TaxID=1844966 RepID=A0ABD2QQA8_9PLAT